MDSMNSLFQFEKIVFQVPDAEIDYYPNFIDSERASELFSKLLAEVAWQHDSITIFGKTYSQPRLTALYGNEGKPYSYSNLKMHPHLWTPLLLQIKAEVEAICQVSFTTVLLNYYRDGNDSNGWHADNEKELGVNPVIASVSLGASRRFHLRHNSSKAEKLQLTLTSGSLLVMQGTTQHFWKHQLPKTTKIIGPRINLTFRIIQ
jgi:alkylated DNA repair dioxygenase AlkB